MTGPEKACCLFVCLQKVMGQVYRALLQQQHQLAISMQDVKSSIQAGPLPDQELQRAALTSIAASLADSGRTWWILDDGIYSDSMQLLSINPLLQPPSRSCTSKSIRISASVLPPQSVILHLATGGCCKHAYLKFQSMFHAILGQRRQSIHPCIIKS